MTLKKQAYRISDRLHHLAEPVSKVIAKTGVPPNAVTLFGFGVNFIAAWLLATGHFLIGGFTILIAGVFDLLDGALARVTGKGTIFGALLDSTIDRYSEAVLLFGLLVYFARRHDTTEVMLIFATVVGSMTVSYARARAEGLGLDADVGLMRRTLRICTLALGLLINQVLAFLWILAVLTNFTAWQRMLYVWRRTKKQV